MQLVLQTQEWIFILMALVAVVFLLVLMKFLMRAVYYIGSPKNLYPTNMDLVKCNNFILCMLMGVSIYKQSKKCGNKKGCSSICLILEGVRGVCCELATKERIFYLSLFMKPAIVFWKPESVKALLSSTDMTEKSVHYDMVHSWLGTGLFTSPSEKWKKRRKLLTPTFHLSILENFIPIFQEQSDVLVSKLRSLSGEPWIDIAPLATLCTLDIICQTIMGVKINAQANGNKEYVQAVHELTTALISRALQPWLYPDIIYYMTTEGKKFRSNLELVHGLSRKVIREKKNEMLGGDDTLKDEVGSTEEGHVTTTKRKAFLEFLLEYHFKDSSFTEEDIREEVDTFIFGGHDTTGTAISWFLYCMGLYPDIQNKVFEELEEIFQNNDKKKLTREDLTNTKYLECCIKEALRLYPPAPFFMRECVETFQFLDYTIYPGSFCFVFPYAMHRDPESFPDPEKFIPERFFPDNSKERHPFAYIPFSAGPRNCIGQKFAMIELKILAANILRRFRITSLDPRDKVLIVPSLTLQNAEPLRLSFEIREDR